MARYGTCRLLRMLRDFGCEDCMPVDAAGKRCGYPRRGVDICGTEACPEWEPLYNPASPPPADRAEAVEAMRQYRRS